MEEKDGGRSRVEREVKVCQSALSKYQRRGLGSAEYEGGRRVGE